MKKGFVYSVIFCLLMQLVGCAKNGGADYHMADSVVVKLPNGLTSEASSPNEIRHAPPVVVADADESISKSAATPSEVQRKLIYNAVLRMQVADLDESAKKVKQIITAEKGYYTNQAFADGGSGSEKSVTFSLRVPSASFEKTLTEMEKLATFIRENRKSSQDVTEQFYDSEIRLKTKRKTLEQYYAILQKTGTIKDILEVQAKINELETEIEGLEGKLRYLNNQTQYSTIDLTLYVPIPFDPHRTTDPENSFFTQLKLSFMGGVTFLREMFLGLISLWPLILVIVALVWYIRKHKSWSRFWQNFRRKPTTPNPPPNDKDA